MHIITGKAKGRRLDTLEGLETRPTTEKVKEAVFSMIQFQLENTRVLDLFAGSGQLGLEALSRGASQAVFVDQSRAAVRVIEKNVKTTGFTDVSRIVCNDYRAFIREASGRKSLVGPYDVVFLDPPYAMGAVIPALSALSGSGLLRTGSLIVCESGEPLDLAGLEAAPFCRDGFEVLRESKYGVAHITLLRRR